MRLWDWVFGFNFDACCYAVGYYCDCHIGVMWLGVDASCGESVLAVYFGCLGLCVYRFLGNFC